MWEIHNIDQLQTFGLSLILGLLLCMLYDIIRAYRAVGKPTVFAVFVEDIAFWIVCAFITFMFFLARTRGEIRGYVLVAELIGFIICRLTVSRLLHIPMVFVFRMLAHIKRFSERIFTLCADFVNTLCEKSLKIIKYGAKRLKKLLKSIGGLLYTKRNNVKVEEEDNGEKKKG